MGDRRFDADVSDAPVFHISEAMTRVIMYNVEIQARYVDTSITQ
jgi:hypothetical protein